MKNSKCIDISVMGPLTNGLRKISSTIPQFLNSFILVVRYEPSIGVGMSSYSIDNNNFANLQMPLYK